MESTPKAEKVQDDSSSFNTSSMFESTPKAERDATPHLPKTLSKKRKVQQYNIVSKNMDDPLSTPQASSTLNESLFRKFESIELDKCDTPPSKYFKTNDCGKLVTPPSTPESHRRFFGKTPIKTRSYQISSVPSPESPTRFFDETPIKTGSYQKCSSSCKIGTPLKEQHEILYPTLKPLEPGRRILTPQKFRERLLRHSTPDSSRNKESYSLLDSLLDNRVIMDNILQYVSGGDLFRLSMVSQGFKNAVNNSFVANIRFKSFKKTHKQNRENYKITPPSSPETKHDSLFQDGSLSPRSRNYNEFFETANSITQNQSLVRCPKCQKPSVVERSIAQCQNKVSCGYIFCRKCESHSYNPELFYDVCRDLRLESSQSHENKRHLLGDVTNSSIDMNFSAVLNSMGSSGYYSGYNTSHSPLSVKRNLSTSSFGTGRDSSHNAKTPITPKPQRALFEHNSYCQSFEHLNSFKKKDDRKSTTTSVIAVVKSDTIRKKIQVVEPSSPPRVKTYAAGSKESKKSLKRLTR